MRVAQVVKAGIALGMVLTGFTIAWSRGNQSERFATRALTFSGDGATVYASGMTGSNEAHHGFVGAWDANSGKQRWRAETADIGSFMSVSPDDKRVVYVDWNGGKEVDARVYDAQTGTLRWRQTLVRVSPSPIYTLRAPVFSTDGRRIFLAYTDGIQVLDAATGAKVAFWSSDGKSDQSVGRVVPTPNGKTLLIETHSDVYGGHNEPDDVVQVWDARDGHLIRTLAKGADMYTDFAPDGTRLALVNRAGQLRVKSLTGDRNLSAALIPAATKATFTGLQFTDAETVEVTGWKKRGDDQDYHCWMWNTRTGTVRDKSAWYPGRFTATSPKGNPVAASPDNTEWTTVPASLHDRQTGRTLLDLQAGTD